MPTVTVPLKRWIMFAMSSPSPTYKTPDWHDEQRHLSEAGYRGSTTYETREDAAAAATKLLDKLASVAPSLKWVAVWACPTIYPGEHVTDEGRCYMSDRLPSG